MSALTAALERDQDSPPSNNNVGKDIKQEKYDEDSQTDGKGSGKMKREIKTEPMDESNSDSSSLAIKEESVKQEHGSPMGNSVSHSMSSSDNKDLMDIKDIKPVVPEPVQSGSSSGVQEKRKCCK